MAILTDYELKHYKAASRAAVIGYRRMLARALRLLHRTNRDVPKRASWHATHVGWPVRERPNGRYL
jgi:hypothetical protein